LKFKRKIEGGFVKNTLALLYLLALCSLPLFAQTGERPRFVHTTEKSTIHVPPEETPATLTKIYSNLGSKTDLYDDVGGWAIDGPGCCGGGYYDSAAIPFTPKSNSHVSGVGAAVEYDTGANQVNVSIYGDTDGLPGTLLAGPVTVINVPEDGTCCALAVAKFPSVALTGGTQYWVVVGTALSGTGSDFQGVWHSVAKIVPIAFQVDAGNWFADSANLLPAVEVLGTIP
jgi:hypothetical protein